MKAKIKRFWKRLKKVVMRADMLLLPGQLAFFIVLAIIPTMTLITYGASVLNLSVDFLYNFLQKAFSTDIANLLLSSSNATNAGLKLSFVIIICYYLASNGMASLIVTSNTIYGIKNGNWFQRRFKAIILTILLVLMIVFLLIVPIFGDKILNLILSVNLNSEVSEKVARVFFWLQNPISWIFIYFMIKLIYIFTPNKLVKYNRTTYGALFTTIMWIITTAAYSYYINNIANYSAFYGGLTSVCILMAWFYFLAYIFVLGMALNVEIEIEINNMEKEK